MLSAFTSWLWNAIINWLSYLYNSAVDLINGAIAGFVVVVAAVAAMLPDYQVPVPSQIIDQNSWLSTLNWLLPISFFINVISMMVVAYSLYLVVGTLLRWGKVLKG